jgi:hypothetical protein
MDENFN